MEHQITVNNTVATQAPLLTCYASPDFYLDTDSVYRQAIINYKARPILQNSDGTFSFKLPHYIQLSGTSNDTMTPCAYSSSIKDAYYQAPSTYDLAWLFNKYNTYSTCSNSYNMYAASDVVMYPVRCYILTRLDTSTALSYSADYAKYASRYRDSELTSYVWVNGSLNRTAGEYTVTVSDSIFNTAYNNKNTQQDVAYPNVNTYTNYVYSKPYSTVYSNSWQTSADHLCVNVVIQWAVQATNIPEQSTGTTVSSLTDYLYTYTPLTPMPYSVTLTTTDYTVNSSGYEYTGISFTSGTFSITSNYFSASFTPSFSLTRKQLLTGWTVAMDGNKAIVAQSFDEIDRRLPCYVNVEFTDDNKTSGTYTCTIDRSYMSDSTLTSYTVVITLNNSYTGTTTTLSTNTYTDVTDTSTLTYTGTFATDCTYDITYTVSMAVTAVADGVTLSYSGTTSNTLSTTEHLIYVSNTVDGIGFGCPPEEHYVTCDYLNITIEDDSCAGQEHWMVLGAGAVQHPDNIGLSFFSLYAKPYYKCNGYATELTVVQHYMDDQVLSPGYYHTANTCWKYTEDNDMDTADMYVIDGIKGIKNNWHCSGVRHYKWKKADGSPIRIHPDFGEAHYKIPVYINNTLMYIDEDDLLPSWYYAYPYRT